MIAASLIGQTAGPTTTGGGIPQLSNTALLVIFGGLALVVYLYFANKDVGRRRHQPSRRRRDTSESSAEVRGCNDCPPDQSTECVSAYDDHKQRRPVRIYIDDDACCGGTRLTQAQVQRIVDKMSDHANAEDDKAMAEQLLAVMGKTDPPKRKS